MKEPNFDMSVSLSGVGLKNPVIPASGCFGFGYEMSRYYDLDRLGGISLKGTTLNPRYGNPLPRVAECPGGMLNSVGLQNPGVKAVIEKEIPRLSECFDGCVIANVSGFAVDEYVECCDRLDKVERVNIIELNVSCPNVHGGGMSFGTSCQGVAEVTKAVRSVIKKPLYVKLSPNVTDIVSIAAAAMEAGADGICLINTLLGMRIDLRTRKPVLANRAGGYSGPGVFPVAVRMIHAVSETLGCSVIGCGGVSEGRDVLEMMMAGASGVEVGAANLVDPMACVRIIDELGEEMRRYGIERLADIIGVSHNNR